MPDTRPLLMSLHPSERLSKCRLGVILWHIRLELQPAVVDAVKDEGEAVRFARISAAARSRVLA